MFSGKTEELIRRVRRALFAHQKVQAFKPSIDNRFSPTRIVSHGDVTIDAVPVPTTVSLINAVDPDTQVVAIDEAQFFEPSIVKIVNGFASRGQRVIVAGLDQDFRGDPFGPMPALMAAAEQVTKVHAVCAQCGQDASRTQRLNPTGDQVQVGGASEYEARCRACHVPDLLP